MKTTPPNDDTGGLARSLTCRQIGMLSLGGALGTGLFLGSALALSLAGPAVVVLYLVGAASAAASRIASSKRAREVADTGIRPAIRCTRGT